MPKWLCIWNLGHETPHACMPMKVFSLMSLDEKKYDVLKIPHTTVIRSAKCGRLCEITKCTTFPFRNDRENQEKQERFRFRLTTQVLDKKQDHDFNLT